MKILLILGSVLFLFIQSPAFSFVLLSGPDEAKLDVSEHSVDITFVWDGSAPSIKEISEVLGPEFDSLSNEEAMRQLIQLALTKWNEVPGSYINMIMEEDLTITNDRDDKVHSIAVKKEKNQTSAAFAVPVVEDKIIIDCDITIGDRSLTAQSLTYTLIHELGHCLGLGHAHTNYGAIMGYSRDNRKLELGADDIAGLIYLYPHPDYKEDYKDFACGSIGGRASQTSNTASLSLLFLFLSPLFLAFFKKQKIGSC